MKNDVPPKKVSSSSKALLIKSGVRAGDVINHEIHSQGSADSASQR
jgi:hypothetical protein